MEEDSTRPLQDGVSRVRRRVSDTEWASHERWVRENSPMDEKEEKLAAQTLEFLAAVQYRKDEVEDADMGGTTD